MGLYRELCFVLMGTLLFSILLLYESRKLDGYKFPVYSTDFCPRNQTEWEERFSAISCNESNGYMCLPNRELTQLLEFCYITPFLWMQEYKCFYLNKNFSRVNDYNCRHFQHGCPTSTYMSLKSFEYQSCVNIGNGCFIADPFCNGITTSPVESTYLNYTEDVTINVKSNTTTNFNDSKEETNKGNGPIANKDWILPLTIILGICIVLLVVCLIGHTALKRKHIEVNENVEFALLYEHPGNIEAEEYSSDTDLAQDLMNENVELAVLNVGQDDLETIENGSDTDSSQGSKNENVRPAVLIERYDNMETEENSSDKDSAQESSIDVAKFDLWQREQVMFIPTTACEEVENLTKKRNLVIVVGQSGSGKSAIIQHIALKYRSQGWAVKPVTEVDEIIKAYESNKILPNKTLFVINDPIGKESFDEMAFASWKKNDSDLLACLGNIKILLSCRKCVQCDIRAQGFFKDDSNVIDIDSGKCILSDDEKQQILNKYNTNDYVFSETDLEEVLKTKKYFPLLCKLFFSDTEKHKDGVNFFTKPVKKIKEEIGAFRIECKEKYCALILIVLFNNKLCVGDLWNDKYSKTLYEHALKMCGMSTTTALSTIGDALETLKDGFVSKIGNAYQFCHDLIMEITSYVFGSDYPRDMIKYADIGFLRKRVKLQDHNVQTDQLTIYISDGHLDSLAERLLKEIGGKKILDVALNPCLKDRNVADALRTNLDKHPERMEMLLENQKLHDESQHFIQESKELFYSKLDFLCWNCFISPVKALIVFSHTDLSLFCLKAIRQRQNNYIQSSFFFAVCCNGAIDLFNLFLKVNVKTFFEDTWDDLHPIHILSLFHNYEILQELIYLGVDLNQKTVDGWTALSLAIRNITAESSEENIDIPTNARYYRTVELLLSNGADINSYNRYEYSPLIIAFLNGHKEIAQLLLSHGANINFLNEFGESPLHTACLDGDDNNVRFLQRHGADINLSNENEVTPLHAACQKGHKSTVKLLLNLGADINFCNDHRESPLYIACQNGYASTVHLLLSHGADINLCNYWEESPLYTACENGHDSTVHILLSHGADIKLCDFLERSPLDAACRNKKDSIVQLLRSRGPDNNLCNDHGESPLYIACQNGN